MPRRRPLFCLIAALCLAGCPGAREAATVEGVVSGDFQDHDADSSADFGGFFVVPAGEEGPGIFVADRADAADVDAGDTVRITGRYAHDGLRFIADTIEVTGTAPVDTVELRLPVPDDVERAEYLRNYLGRRVRIPGEMTIVDHRDLERSGALLFAAGERPAQFTNAARPDAADAAADELDFERAALLLDDGRNEEWPRPLRYRALDGEGDRPLRLGDRVRDLTGILHFGLPDPDAPPHLAAFRLLPVDNPVFVSGNPRPPLPGKPAEGIVRVTALNAMNFFRTPDRGSNRCGPDGDECRGADSVAEYDRQRAKLVSALAATHAHIAALMEIENDAGATLAELADALSSRTGNDWRSIDTGPIGGDAIRVAVLYDAGRVAPRGQYRVLDSRGDARFLEQKNRPPLAQTFVAASGTDRFTVVVNHLKSKGSSCEDVGDPDRRDGQGNCNLTRTRAAQAIADWLDTDPTASDDDDVLIIGDLNAYLREDPIVALENEGYVNLLSTDDSPPVYTYVYGGRTGALDHALASPSLAARVRRAFVWHVNADELPVRDYNLDGGRNPGLFSASTPYRSSDHDPIIVDIETETAGEEVE